MSRRVADPFREARLCDCGSHGFVGLSRGFVALVSPAAVPLIAPHRWSVSIHGGGKRRYASTNVARAGGGFKRLYMHRLLVPGGQHTDHASGDGLDNRDSNLRACTARDNMRNRPKHRQGRLPFKGIKALAGGKFGAQLRLEQGQVWLGTFTTPEDAARAYDAAAVHHFGAFARTNVDLGLLPPVAA